MKAVILAAGCGYRLRPYTVDRPKCLLSFAGETLLQRQVRTLTECGIEDISVVTGHRADRLAGTGLRCYFNSRYEHSNLVASLLCAEAELEGDVIVCYSDILYEKRLIERLVSAPASDLVVLVDEDWQPYYEKRFGREYGQRTGFVVAADGRILSTQRAAVDRSESQAQYIGLVRFGPSGCHAFRHLFRNAPTADRAVMRDVIEALIQRRVHIDAAIVRRGWLEVDTVEDYEQALGWYDDRTLHEFIRL
jgi:L-glutamine-phosphate cytidylyltransferase